MSQSTNKPLHILIIPSFYPRFDGDYVGSFWREQAIGLSKQNIKVGLIFPFLPVYQGTSKPRLPLSDYHL